MSWEVVAAAEVEEVPLLAFDQIYDLHHPTMNYTILVVTLSIVHILHNSVVMMIMIMNQKKKKETKKRHVNIHLQH
jgi:hypothetical protein